MAVALVAVTTKCRPSASIESQTPPTVAVTQSKPPQVRYDSAGYPGKEYVPRELP